MKKTATVLMAAGLLVLAACSKKSNPSKASETPAPAPAAPTYSGRVQGLIETKCTPCHIPSKGGRKTDLDSYASAMKYGADIVKRIELNPTDRGFMPMRGTKLSADEIAVFKKWVDGGMPEK